MVVIIEAGAFEALGLGRGQHAERGAGLQPQRLDPFDHLDDAIEVAVLGAAPGGADAKAPGADRLGALRRHHDLVGVHDLCRPDPGLVTGALGAVAAILGAAAGLDVQQGAELHLVGVEIAAIKPMGAEQEIVERKLEQRERLGDRPVMANLRLVHGRRSGSGGVLVRRRPANGGGSVVPKAAGCAHHVTHLTSERRP